MCFVYVEGDVRRNGEVGDGISWCWVGAGGEDRHCVLLDGQSQIIEGVLNLGLRYRHLRRK
jgi:hypothetical protein